MKVLLVDKMPDGTLIQIEDWSDNYPTIAPYGSTLASYPISKASHEDEGQFAPKKNNGYRFCFNFKSYSDTLDSFKSLVEGKLLLKNFKKEFSSKKEYFNCL